MSATELISRMSQAIFVIVFIALALQVVRHPRRGTFDACLFFGVLAAVVVESWVVTALQITPPAVVSSVVSTFIMALPYLLLRLLEDFAGSRPLVRRLTEAGLLLAAIALFAAPMPLPSPVSLLLVAYFVAVVGYVGAAFLRAPWSASGIAKRRLLAVAAGSIFLAVDILISGLRIALPDYTDLWTALIALCGLASAVCFAVGFATPGWLKRVWQDPEMRQFFGENVMDPGPGNAKALIAELEQGAARTLGATGAVIGLWEADARTVVFQHHPLFDAHPEGLEMLGVTVRDGQYHAPESALLAAGVIKSGEPQFFENAPQADPKMTLFHRAAGIQTLLAAPIRLGDETMGFLEVFSAYTSIFAEDDLETVQLLADQCALALASRRLLEENARVQAQAESSRLKEDFLSSIAHDLRTPLTTMLLQGQRVQRVLARRGDELASDVAELVDETRRLNTMVQQTLYVARAEGGRLVLQRDPVDLAELARAAIGRPRSPLHEYRMEAPEPVMGHYDATLLSRVLDNLLENAAKYSPQGGDIMLRVWREHGEARLSVSDQGIGIPPAELTRLFERFYRGSNVDDRRFSGIGLGLYICRLVIEGHGGRIWASSQPGEGATINVALPITEEV